MAHEDDVLSQAPLFEALSQDDARALRSDVIHVSSAAASGCSRGRRRRQALHHPEGQDQAHPGRATTAGRTCSACIGPGEMFGELSLFDPGPRT